MRTMVIADELTVRRAEPEEIGAVIAVCGSALAWSEADNNDAFFRWKHLENPFGPSPIWVATEPSPSGTGDSIVGVRAMMRWELSSAGGERRTLTRAVDTATLPSHQGRGIFSRLTMTAVKELTDQGDDAVFNTPNDKSRPGYLKMGWQTVGRVPVVVRPRSVGSLLAMARSRVPAEKWGLATDVGLAPSEAFADLEALGRTLRALGPEGRPSNWSTPLSPAYLRWRTAFEPLACRVLPIGGTLDDGFVVFRLRHRGELRQLSLLHIVGVTSSHSLRRAVSGLMKRTGADVALAAGKVLGSTLRPASGLVPLPKAGPLLTWRPLDSEPVPPMRDLDLPLGTIELF